MKPGFTVPALAAVLALASSCVWAQSGAYPARPVRLVAPFPPGGSVDLVARMVASALTETLGQPVLVDNRSGASGNIGTELVANAAPDGYTLMLNTLPLVTNAFLFPRVPYHVSDFAPISLIASSPSIATVHPSLPAHSIRELLQLARAKPGALNYATAGIGTNPHIAGELFNFLGKVNIVAVHYKGGGPGLIATMGGEVGCSFSNIAETSVFVKSKRLRGLGVTSLTRTAVLPDVPTIAEAGLPGYEFVTWQGLLAPKATPRAIVTLLNERLKKALQMPAEAQRFTDRGLDVIASSPEAFQAHLQSEVVKWGRVVKERGMRAE
jgi:tripartite-type tricarboxylate transporter receptor subunit TctC